MKAGRHSNLAVRFGAILALGLLAGNGAQAASATGTASVTILAPETISVKTVTSSAGSSVNVENTSASGYLSLRMRPNVEQVHVPSQHDAAATLQPNRPSTIVLPSATDHDSRTLIVIYHHF